MRYAVLDLRKCSLLRGTLLVLGSLFSAFLLAGFPNDRPSLILLIPTLIAFAGTWDTIRCLRSRWSFYHGAVVLLIYTDMMALFMILFLLLYPYAQWISL
jgi:hypothetical protein